jgi:hypothetical protein
MTKRRQQKKDASNGKFKWFFLKKIFVDYAF